MTALLSLTAFLSGAAALLYESLWLRQAGLLLGSSVWASSIVLASFMTGLALGNALAVRWAPYLSRPLRWYAGLELLVAVTAAAVVLAAPALTPVCAPLFRRLAAAPGLTNLVRLAVAFGLMLLPTTAMGLGLPVLTRAVSRGHHDFGRVLGRLYGWNTLGGVLGAVAGELGLVAACGVRGTAGCAAGSNLLAAALAVWLSPRLTPVEACARYPGRERLGARAWRLLGAAFLAGAALLGLEVIWFRFLQLFLFGTSLTFAFMLAVILLGMGLGGLLASRWLRRDPGGHQRLPAVAAAAALAVTLSYAAFSPFRGGAAFFISEADATLALSLRLMLATAVVSGVLFTLQGAALRRELGGAGETTGHLTFANTLGAMTGALGAGFVLLPRLGMERSLFVLVAFYGVVAVLCGPFPMASASSGSRWLWRASLVAVGLCLLGFPRGAMVTRYLPASLARFLPAGTRVVAQREGVNQTTTILRREWGGSPVAYRLVTNGYSMSGTDYADRRYMKLFVYWAVAVNPNIRQALLVSYGLGSTAKALTDTRSLTGIHVVDISRDILDMSAVVFAPAASPLADSRVHVHVEDGRFFLQTTGETFDLITGEPPPPKASGVVNLYSREYFQLLHARLREGGVATYWLPVEELDEGDARAVVAAFCAVFADCSLWSGAGAHWMLAGTRGLRTAPTEAEFTAQWRDPVVKPELIGLGFEMPEQLGATFLADRQQLAPWLSGALPLDDDHPHRLSPARPHPAQQKFIDRWMDEPRARLRFERSQRVRTLWPPPLRRRSLDLFTPQRVVNDVTSTPVRFSGFEALRDLLVDSPLRTLPLLVAGSNPVLQAIAHRGFAGGARSPALAEQMAISALAGRDYPAAADRYAKAAATGGRQAVRRRIYQAFALAMAEQPDAANRVLTTLGAAPGATPDEAQGLRWLHAMLDGMAETTKPDAHE
jgi:spermidine synthase